MQSTPPPLVHSKIPPFVQHTPPPFVHPTAPPFVQPTPTPFVHSSPPSTQITPDPIVDLTPSCSAHASPSVQPLGDDGDHATTAHSHHKMSPDEVQCDPSRRVIIQLLGKG